MSVPDHEGARQYALGRLQSELPPALTYHSLIHTRDLVMRAAEHLARLEGIPQEQTDLLVTAAAFHDLGYLVDPANHERASARIARETLPAYGFTEEQIGQITSLIMATRLPQQPRNHLEELLADADLAVLGMDIFMERSTALRAEHAAAGKTYTDEEWAASQSQFLKSHHYFSPAARQLFAQGKRENLGKLDALLGRRAVKSI